MDIKTFLIRNIMMPFFISVTCICVAIAIIGLVYDPDAHLSYQALFSPIILGATTTFPSLVNYSKRELSVREAFMRKVIQFILIEIIVQLIVHPSGAVTSLSVAVSLALSVLLVFSVVHLVSWINDRRTADEFNIALKKMQESRS